MYSQLLRFLHLSSNILYRCFSPHSGSSQESHVPLGYLVCYSLLIRTVPQPFFFFFFSLPFHDTDIFWKIQSRFFNFRMIHSLELPDCLLMIRFRLNIVSLLIFSLVKVLSIRSLYFKGVFFQLVSNLWIDT